MNKIRYVVKQGFTAVVAVCMVGLGPAPVFADSVAPSQDTSTSSVNSDSYPNNRPTGAEGVTFHYNADTGLWENDYYTYDPATGIKTPKVPLEYTYDPATGQWDTTIWQYGAAQQAYQQVQISVPVVPDGAITHGGPTTDANGTPALDASGTGNSATPLIVPTATSVDTADTPLNALDTNGGGSSPDTQSDDSTAKNITNNTTGTTLNNTINSTAQSGNATADDNDDIGTVSSGDGNATANVINLLQSQASFAGSGVATFTKDIQGDVTGDLLIDPGTLTGSTTINPSGLTNAKINNVTDASITNNINLLAGSGNALANDNDDVDSVASGNANAIADVINMINSVVAANKSFVGTINIYGNYTGNILMPADSLNALLGSASPAPLNTSTVVNNADTTNIANNVDLAAKSGNATAGNNDSVGSVISGNALTNLTILNLTGHQVIAANSLLVFVNVMGTWVGLIMDAPAGATSAALGGGVTNNAVLADASKINNTGNFGITNNITAHATSGDATATDNDDVGSVASGNATASANIANLVNSTFSVSNWFGILFINVFGSWHGNFAVMQPPVVMPPITSGASGPAGGSDPVTDIRAFAFVPGGMTAHGAANFHLAPLNGSGGGSGSTTTNGSTGSDSESFSPIETAGKVLGTATKIAAPAKQALENSTDYWSIALLTIGAAGFGIVGIERVRSAIRRKTIVQ